MTNPRDTKFFDNAVGCIALVAVAMGGAILFTLGIALVSLLGG